MTESELNEENTYILVQNKYYTKESSDISKYDAPKIYSRAKDIFDKVDKFKVVLMVNSKQILSNKLKDYDKKHIEILGVEEIEPWFQSLLYDLYTNDIKKFIKGDLEISRRMEPRFHQRLFIDSTIEHYNGAEKKRKFRLPV